MRFQTQFLKNDAFDEMQDIVTGPILQYRQYQNVYTETQINDYMQQQQFVALAGGDDDLKKIGKQQ